MRKKKVIKTPESDFLLKNPGYLFAILFPVWLRECGIMKFVKNSLKSEKLIVFNRFYEILFADASINKKQSTKGLTYAL